MNNRNRMIRSKNEQDLYDAVCELVEIVEQEMGGDWAREFIEKKLSKYTTLLNKIDEEIRKELRKFYFTDNSWWDSQGCSCCEESLMEVYNSEDTDHSLGTAHSKLECYIQAISTVIIKRNHSCDFDPEALYFLKEQEIEDLCKAMGIEVEIYD